MLAIKLLTRSHKHAPNTSALADFKLSFQPFEVAFGAGRNGEVFAFALPARGMPLVAPRSSRFAVAVLFSTFGTRGEHLFALDGDFFVAVARIAAFLVRELVKVVPLAVFVEVAFVEHAAFGQRFQELCDAVVLPLGPHALKQSGGRGHFDGFPPVGFAPRVAANRLPQTRNRVHHGAGQLPAPKRRYAAQLVVLEGVPYVC